VTVTTLHVWRVPPAAVPRAFWGMAVNRGRLRRQPGVRFVKLLGTGKGSAFGATSADLTRWAALMVSDGPPPRPAPPHAIQYCTLTLSATSSRGSWSGRTPFETRAPASPQEMVLVLTRARIRARQAPRFWRAIDPVAQTLTDQDGLLAAFGFGEAPLGFQGTASLWRGAQDVIRFAYRQPEHAAVVERTPREGWYAEELFARFTVLDIEGDRGVIGWKEGP
jgi:hypothetical protein